MTSTATKTSPTKAKTAAAKKKAEAHVVPDTAEGTWQHTIVKSGALLARGVKATAAAGTLLWQGSQEGILDWLEDRADDDVNGEGLYNELVSLLGKPRRGDANKIKTVALAVKNNGLVLSQHPSLTKAYGEAKRLTVTVKQNEEDDHAAEEFVEALTAPKSTSKPEGAASILLKQGVDEATRLIVDSVIEAAGGYEQAEPVLRSLLRSLSQEIVGRKPKPEPKTKTEATITAPSKAKAPAKTKAKPKPNPKADREDAAGEPVDEADIADPIEDDEILDDSADEVEEDDAFAALDDDADEADDEVSEDVTPEVPVKQAAAAKKKARPVVRRG